MGKPEPTGKIPGYAGYVHAIKPENLYSSTFGKTTLNVESDDYVRGQDFESRDKYVTTNTNSYMPPSERFQRTAADIVGVPPCQIKVKAVNIVLFSLKSQALEKRSINSLKARVKISTIR